MCPIAPTVFFSLISCLAKTFLKSSPYASFHLQIAILLVSTPRSLSLLTLFACHHCIHFVITCIVLITRLLTVGLTLYAKITHLFLMFYVNFYLLEVAVLILVFLVVVILMILLRIFVTNEIVAYCGRVYLMLYKLWALFVGFSGGLCF